MIYRKSCLFWASSLIPIIDTVAKQNNYNDHISYYMGYLKIMSVYLPWHRNSAIFQERFMSKFIDMFLFHHRCLVLNYNV